MIAYLLSHATPWSYYRIRVDDTSPSALIRIHNSQQRVQTCHRGKWIQEPELMPGRIEFDFIMDLVTST